MKKKRVKERNDYFEKLSWKIVENLSVDEQIGQIFHVAVPGKILNPQTQKMFKNIRPGGIILFGRNLGNKEEIQRLTHSLQINSKIPLFISTDQEGGKVKRVMDGVTQFPGAMALGQTQNSTYAYQVGFITSYELNSLGINLLLAPVLDINNNPKNPVINTRSFGSNLETVLNTAIPYQKGARNGGAIPVIKHFPGHGDTNIDSHLDLPIIDKSLEELQNFELIPFKVSIQEGAKAIMSAHIVFKKVDPKYPVTLSKIFLTDILRKQMNFQGLIFTDDLEMDAIDKHFKNEQQALKSILAGANVLLLSSWGKNSLLFKKQLKKFFLNSENRNLLKKVVQKQILLKVSSGLFHKYSKNRKLKYSDFFEKKNLFRTQRYNKIEKDKLNQEISMDSICSLYKDQIFKPKTNFFILKDLFLENYILNLNLENYQDFSYIQKDTKKSRIIMDIRNQEDILFYEKIALKNKDIEFVFLNYSNPFFKYKKLDNLTVLFSFSNTKQSKIELIRSILEHRKIKKNNLIFR